MCAIKNNIDNEEKKDKEHNEPLENTKEIGAINIPKPEESIQILPIIGQIEGHMVLPPQTKATKYEHMIPQLLGIEMDSRVEGVLIVLNTVGGDVEAGLAIAEMIQSLSKPTVSIVIGGGHSIGVPLATAANYSFISPTATMIIHPIRMNGIVVGAPQTFEYFNKMQDRILDFITRTSDISRETLKHLMLQSDDLLNDLGTILIGKQAVDYGIIKEVGGISNAIGKLKSLIEENKKKDCKKRK